MTHLQMLRVASILKWVSSNFYHNHLRSSTAPFQPVVFFSHSHSPRLYRSKSATEDENLDTTSNESGENAFRISNSIRKEGQAALLEYLHGTRGFQFVDAENMSKNSPNFLEKLLRLVNNEKQILMKKNNGIEIGREITRFLRYHPINEFEPFFECLGLQPSEYFPLLPRSLMFLTDDQLLVHNYTALCHYGIARDKIGKIYKEAREVFQCDFQVLELKLQAYDELGLSQCLSQSTLVKFFVASPYLLLGDVSVEFFKTLKKLRSIGLETDWIVGNLLADSSYNWSQMLEVLSLFNEMGCSDEQLSVLIGQHPDILFESSGGWAISLIGFLLKFGYTKNQICSIFLQFPHIPVVKFVSNLRLCILFLNEIEMEVVEIRKIVHSHPILLGSCSLKKSSSLLSKLNTGKKRLCTYIQENPQELKNWVLGKRIEPFPDLGEDLISKALKTKFLLDIGFVENSNKMKEALKEIRGRGGELQERFDCIVKAGLSRQDVCEMINISPQVLNQSKDVIEVKIDFLVNQLGYPLSSLVTFPRYLSHKTERVQLRVFMYNWLKDHGIADPGLSLSTIICCSNKYFIENYVNRHTSGPGVWQDLKNKVYSEY